jgi:transposase-like protein
MICKKCNCSIFVKNGKPNKIQRFKCKNCGKSTINQDNRLEYDDKPKQIAVILRTEGNGFRSIARTLSEIFDKKIHYQTVQKWLKNYHLKMQKTLINTDQSDIEILELDELYTYFKKNPSKQEFGLLLTATKTKLLRLVLAQERK